MTSNTLLSVIDRNRQKKKIKRLIKGLEQQNIQNLNDICKTQQ